MKLPVEWLREFIQTPLDDDALAAKLTMAGLEVEETTLSEDGPVFHTKVTPNRGDWMSVVGTAREAAAALDIPLNWSPAPLPEEDSDILRWVGVRVENAKHCPRYAGKLIRNVVFRPSPDWMQRRLLAAGMRPLNVVVDITNYVMLELGQPLHAFDYATLPEGQIVVRSARVGESIETLDGAERALSQEMLLICDRDKPIGIAGVMGGAKTEVSSTTRHIFLESACFDPGSIRRTSKALGLTTEASYRFERSVDPELVPLALERACDLLAELANGEVVLGRIDLYPQPALARELTLRTERTNAILGTSLSQIEIAQCLKRLGMTIQANGEPLTVFVPSFRPDLVQEIDLIEEVGRMIGYETLPETLPPARGGGGGDASQGILAARLRTILIGLGLSEALTHSLSAPSPFEEMNEEGSRVTIRQALSAELSGLRQSLIPNLLDALARNLRQRQSEVQLFEVGKVFSLAQRGYRETRHVAAVMTGTEVDFFTAKGLIESIACSLHLSELDFSPDSRPHMHPTRCATVSLGSEIIGYVAEVDPEAAQTHLDLPATVGRIAVFELNADALLPALTQTVHYHSLPRFPAITRDIAALVDMATPYALLENTAREAVDHSTLESIGLQSVYSGERVPEGKKSVALRLSFRAADRTLTDGEVDAQMAAVEALFAERTGAERR